VISQEIGALAEIAGVGAGEFLKVVDQMGLVEISALLSEVFLAQVGCAHGIQRPLKS